MAFIENKNENNEQFWVDGQPFEGIKNNLLVDTGTEKYWVDGQPVGDLFPKSNLDTGKFYFLFEG